MAAKYFADAWFFIAFTDRLDAHHRRAVSLVPRVGNDLVTTESVLTEVLAYFSGYGADTRAKAATAARHAIRAIDVVTIGRAFFLRALNLYEERADKRYSLTDCMSMVVMRDRGISHVLTNDHHFRQEGFTLVNE